jgi:hypothetical protein
VVALPGSRPTSYFEVWDANPPWQAFPFFEERVAGDQRREEVPDELAPSWAGVPDFRSTASV